MLSRDRMSFKQLPKDQTGDESTDVINRATLWHCMGIFMSLIGSIIAVIALFSFKWIVLVADHKRGKAEDDFDDFNLNLYFGPWKAGRENGEHDKPWKIVPGLDKSSMQWTQILVTVAVIAYLGGIVILLFKCIAHNLLNHNHKFQRLSQIPLLEITSSLASVTSLVIILVMGQLKRAVILSHHQTLKTGPGFLLTLISLLITVIGVLFMAFNRNGIKSFLNGYTRLQQKLCKNHDAGTQENDVNASDENSSPSSNSNHQRPISTVMGISREINQSDLNTREEINYDLSYSKLPPDMFRDRVTTTQDNKPQSVDRTQKSIASTASKVFPEDDFLLFDTRPNRSAETKEFHVQIEKVTTSNHDNSTHSNVQKNDKVKIKAPSECLQTLDVSQILIAPPKRSSQPRVIQDSIPKIAKATHKPEYINEVPAMKSKSKSGEASCVPNMMPSRVDTQTSSVSAAFENCFQPYKELRGYHLMESFDV